MVSTRHRVCDRAAAGSGPVHTGLPPIRGRSENTFHVLRLPQLRTPGPTPRTRAPYLTQYLVSSQPAALGV